MDQVRGRWLCLGVLCLKSQIPSTKLQINLKLQITNSKPVQRAGQMLAPRERLFFFVWDFEFRSLLFVCFLGFVIWARILYLMIGVTSANPTYGVLKNEVSINKSRFDFDIS